MTRKRELEAQVAALEADLKVALVRADVAEQTLAHIARLVTRDNAINIRLDGKEMKPLYASAGRAALRAAALDHELHSSTSTRGPHYANYVMGTA